MKTLTGNILLITMFGYQQLVDAFDPLSEVL